MADKTLIIQEAQKFLARGQIDRAIAEWEKLIREAPDGNTFNIIGDLYLKKGEKRDALESFHKAASFFREEGFSLKALALYKKVLNIDPADAEALCALGELSEEKGLATDAMKYYLATADSLSKGGKKERLLEIYQKILSLSPANVPLRSKVAETFLKEGLKGDAAKEYLVIAKQYDDKGDIAKARDYYLKVVEIQPLNKEAVMGMNVLYEKSGEIMSAVDHMKEAALLFHEDKDILFRYAEISLIAGLNDVAKECLRKITEKEPSHIECRRLLGEIYLKEGQKEEAWSEYHPVIDEMVLHEKYEDAISLLKSFQDVDPVETGKRLLSLYRQLGESDAVAAELTSVGDALRAKGLVKEALEHYREALEIRPADDLIRGRIDELTPKPEEVEQPEEPEPSLEEPEVAGEEVTGQFSVGRAILEVLTEADILSKYGLVSEAIRLLEAGKLDAPANIDIHVRLKSLYLETGEKESAVTECLVLSELYRRSGDAENSQGMIREAIEIYPGDPRLAERGLVAAETAEAPQAFEIGQGALETEAPRAEIEDYEEEIAEAEFYIRQGLSLEAAKILERLHDLFPENDHIREMLGSIGQLRETSETEEGTGAGMPAEEKIVESIPMEQSPGAAGEETAQGEDRYENIALHDLDVVDAEAMPEPELDSDVLEIFQEFKKGLEEQLDEEDSETHYNLGIAYKEMGLVDDAIKEFQTARDDPKRFIQSSTMLGVCYMEKALYSLAIEALKGALAKISDKEESFWPIKYDLAEAYEKSGSLKEALDLYTEVYGWNAGYRNVSDKVSTLKIQIAKSSGKGKEKEKPKERKDRVSYL